MKNKGFTLIELLVVMAITGILSSIVLGILIDGKGRYEEANYKICGVDKCYYVESYQRESNCVFLSEKDVRVCGDYEITNLQNE